ncbi:MAG: PRC-barrel domain-containing protein [Isosphaeraceae bacterium]
MKSHLKMIMSLAILSLPFAALAAQAEPASQDSRASLGEIRKVSDLLDSEVFDKTNESLANVEDLIFTPEGKPLYVVLSRGGVVGIGASHFPVPWEALGVRYANGRWGLSLPMTKTALEQAPTFQYDNYRELTNAQWIDKVHMFFRMPASDTAKSDANETDAATARRPVAIVLRASKLIGANVKNPRDEGLGEVEDLLMDRNDRVAFAILGRGGVLNIGTSFIPVPWEKLRLTVNREDTAVNATIDVTKSQLEKAPLVEGDKYATLLGAGYTDQVYRYFGMKGPGIDSDERPRTDRP